MRRSWPDTPRRNLYPRTPRCPLPGSKDGAITPSFMSWGADDVVRCGVRTPHLAKPVIARTGSCNGSTGRITTRSMCYMRVHSSHPQVHKVDIIVSVYLYDCPGCGGEFYVRGAVVQPDGSLRCHQCSEGAGSFRWCPRCHQAKPYNEFESDRVDAGRHQWCLECAAAAKEAARQPVKTCDQCGAEFTSVRRDAHFCSGRCRVAAHRARSVGSGA
jgi:Stc1 domain